MDEVTRCIVDFVLETDFESLTPEAVAATVRHHLDGVGCAAGSFSSEPARIVRELARGVSGHLNASVYGLEDRANLESAAFANGSMNRYLDFNDTDQIPAGHPNDMAPSLFATAEAVGATGRDLITAIYIAYEVVGALNKGSGSLRLRGWDQGAYAAIGATAGASKILGLDREQIANAISLAIVPSIPLRVVRTGVITHWKGCATAFASRNAVFAVQMAKLGMEGPQEPFAGVDGLFSLVSGGPFQVQFGPRGPGESDIERSSFKYYPSEFNSQVPLGFVLELRKEVSLEDIEAIEVATYHLGWHEIGGGQGDVAEKWDPKSRETADHSMPYVLAVALTDGAITLKSFDLSRVLDPKLRPLMNKISVIEDTVMSEAFEHGRWPARVTIRLTDGRILTREGDLPKGAADNPMSDDEVNEKFDSMVCDVLEPEAHAQLRAGLWSLADVVDLDDISSYFRRFRIRGEESPEAQHAKF